MIRSFNDMARRLETSDDLRQRLLADVGHELRTPLTIVRGELEAMADGVRELNEVEVRRLLEDVAGMERLLDDLRTLSTTEAGMLTLHREPTDVTALVRSVVERFRSEADAAGVVLLQSSGVDNAAPAEVNVDPHRIGEVILNLLTNALRAVGPGGRIEVRSTTEQSDGGWWSVIEVDDDGVGLAPDQLEAVFERFHRGADSNGSGLGLTISRGLVEAHGGTLSAAGTPGSGTTMTVRLPG
jgi:histidine kinase